MWQFHTPAGSDLRDEDGRVVSLQLVWQMDPSLAEVADLEPGWVAWGEAAGSAWRRGRGGEGTALNAGISGWE